MTTPQAAIMVLDHIPDADEITMHAAEHLEEFDADEAFATCEILDEPPAWLAVHERDQMEAYLRDGAACVLVIYMREGSMEDYDD